ncbi:MAG TPA: hypothetical protein PLU22_16570, partial [Polyangiaceae bacterium]|nr:hypothetical protein [Polyangiaceae bacterium]
MAQSILVGQETSVKQKTNGGRAGARDAGALPGRREPASSNDSATAVAPRSPQGSSSVQPSLSAEARPPRAGAAEGGPHEGGGATPDDAPERARGRRPGSQRRPRRGRGLEVDRYFTLAGDGTQSPVDPFASVEWERRESTIYSSDGSIVFRMEGAEIPASWSQLATDIVVSKYFRKAGIGGDKDVGETSVRQVVHRVAHTIRVAGEKMGGYFATRRDAEAF